MRHKFLATIAVVGLFFAFAVVEATAQTVGRVEAKIPFDFAAGKVKLKAGAYSVKRLSDRAVKLSSLDGETNAIVSAPLSLDARDESQTQRLVFNHYGDNYFLSQVWLRVDSGQQLMPSSDELKLARDFKRNREGNNHKRVEIALQ